jgi:uncharacterized protein involved in high-affinity Fe2+ transport
MWINKVVDLISCPIGTRKGNLMTKLVAAALVVAVVSTLTGPALSDQSQEVKIKFLATPLDPARETVLVGRRLADDMIIQLEMEPAKGMWMASTATVQLKMHASKGMWVMATTPAQWSEHAVDEGQLYHVEVKPIDPKSKTRIPYAAVKFKAVNKENGRQINGDLHPMWGDSGLHYAINSGLAGDGTYEMAVTVEVPTFARSMKERSRWMEPRTATFHVKLVSGKLTEVSEPDLD